MQLVDIITKMTPPINLQPYRQQITELAIAGESATAICDVLLHTHSVTVSIRTINSRLNDWGIHRPTVSKEAQATEQLILDLYQLCLNTNEVLHILQKNGKAISERTLRRIRKRLGIRLRVDDPTEREQQIEEIKAILLVEDAVGDIEGYGRRLQYVFLRSQGAFFPRDLIFEVYRMINPEAIERRRSDLQRRRGSYDCPGPNWIWHVDGYMKLEPFGLEVYAAIDGYSRFIIWIYVGISARTAISVYRQYLDCVSSTGFIPRRIRADLGSETVMFGDAHLALRQSTDTTAQYKDCFSYGRSVENQRIEAWWAQLASSSIFLYLEYFKRLCKEGFFSKEYLPEQVSSVLI
jgi:hypothetical protein